MTAFEAMQVALLFCSGIGAPLLVLLITMHNSSRNLRFDALTDQIKHIDDCLHGLRDRITRLENRAFYVRKEE